MHLPCRTFSLCVHQNSGNLLFHLFPIYIFQNISVYLVFVKTLLGSGSDFSFQEKKNPTSFLVALIATDEMFVFINNVGLFVYQVISHICVKTVPLNLMNRMV